MRKTEPPIIIVSGIPRSGTSMMMQILQAGGVEIISDGTRKPDRDNPKGYFELEKVKELATEKRWLFDARGKAVKIISQHVTSLPQALNYRVIFMLRNLDETLTSQKIMLENRNTNKPRNDAELRRLFRAHLLQIRKWFTSQLNFEVEYLNYQEAIENGQLFIDKVIRFLQDDQLDRSAMIQSIDDSLYRQRGSAKKLEKI